VELVKFDTRLLDNLVINDVEYQQGTHVGYEVREYLLEKWGRQCAYCGTAGTQLEIEHLIPRSRGGSNRVSNLTLACHACNQRKGNQTAAEYGYPQLQWQAGVPFKDAAIVNTTRLALYHSLRGTGLSLITGTGGMTKFNRVTQDYPKAHWIDAACVGASGQQIFLNEDLTPLHIRATGHGSRQICRTDKYGFPSRYRLRQKHHFGFQTGDIVQVRLPKGKHAGTYVGRVACRATGSFDITTATGKITGVSWRYCRIIHQSDGYTYTFVKDGSGTFSKRQPMDVSVPKNS
jgi:hypothetical protein